jgi:hypothetical protein
MHGCENPIGKNYAVSHGKTPKQSKKRKSAPEYLGLLGNRDTPGGPD